MTPRTSEESRTSPGTHPRDLRSRKGGEEGPARTTESSVRNTMRLSCTRKTSATSPSRCTASRGSVMIGSLALFPEVMTRCR